MNWTKEHIEARMIDAMDGNLSAEDLHKLREYLQEFPEFGSLVDDYPRINDSLMEQFPEESLLKKFPFAPKTYESQEGQAIEKMAIAKLEGLLSEREEQDFDQALKVESALQKEWQFVNQSILKPDKDILFPNEESLLKELRIIPWRSYVSSAVAACILFFLYLGWPSQGPTENATSKSKFKTTPILLQNKRNQIVTAPVWTANKSSLKPINEEHFDPIKNEFPDCIIPENYTESSEQLAQVLTQEQPSGLPIETSPINAINNQTSRTFTASQEPIGLKEFVIQKGNERLFGTSNPSVSERYATIANYMAKSTNIPIDYEQSENEDSETTYLRLGFISIERKRAKK
jgi:hypothetical protein